MTTKLPMRRALGKRWIIHASRHAFNLGAWLFGRVPQGVAATRFSHDSVAGEWLTPVRCTSDVVIYYVHGGGFVACSSAGYRTLSGELARRSGARVFAVDYRLAPEHPFPTPLHDVMRGYEALLATGISPEHIVIAGDSAGANLALSTLVALRERGEPLPAGIVMISPWLDLAASYASFALAHVYLNGTPLDDPRASPFYADLRGLPPMMIHVSAIEPLADDACRTAARARAAQVEVDLRLWDDVPHVWQLLPFLRESKASLDEIAAFVTRVTSSAKQVSLG